MGNQDTKTGGKRKTVIEPNAGESIIINPRFSEGCQPDIEVCQRQEKPSSLAER